MRGLDWRAGILVAFSCLLLSSAAYAERGDDRRFPRRGPFMPQQERALPPDAGRAFVPPPPRDARPGGRLTPEERRQLRQDIFDAGRDVYRDRGDRPPRQRRW